MNLVEAVAQLGFPAAIAAFFVWWTTFQLSKRVDDLCVKLEHNTKAVIALATVIAKDKNIDFREVERLLGKE